MLRAKRFVAWITITNCITYGIAALTIGFGTSDAEFFIQALINVLVSLLFTLILDHQWEKMSEKARFVVTVLLIGAFFGFVTMIAMSSPLAAIRAITPVQKTATFAMASLIAMVVSIVIRYRRKR